MDLASALPRLQSRPKHLPPSVRLQLRIHRSVQHSLKSCTQERVTQLQERVMKQQLQLLQASIRIPEENRNQRQQQAALAPESAAFVETQPQLLHHQLPNRLAVQCEAPLLLRAS
jgi:hypothetical protein